MFKTLELTSTDSGFRAVVAADSENGIYKVHFPGCPVIPGACLVEEVMHLMQHHYGRKMRLRELKSVKFISIIHPDGNDHIEFDIQTVVVKGQFADGSMQSDTSEHIVKATISKGGEICAKMSLIFSD